MDNIIHHDQRPRQAWIPVRLLTRAEVAAIFRVDPDTVTEWGRSGRLTSIRTPGGHRRYRESDIQCLLDEDSQIDGVPA